MKAAGIIVNTTRLREQPEMAASVRSTIETLRRRVPTVWLDVEGAETLGMADQGRPDDELAARAEIIIAFGGDGTILRAARLAARRGVPILGVNLGGFGFLAEISTDDLPGVLPDLLAGHYELDERMMLQVQTDQAQSTAGYLSYVLSGTGKGYGGRKLTDDVVDISLTELSASRKALS